VRVGRGCGSGVGKFCGRQQLQHYSDRARRLPHKGGEIGGTSEGAAYIFVEPLTGWTTATQTAKLIQSNGIDNEFGWSNRYQRRWGGTVVVGTNAGARLLISSSPIQALNGPPTTSEERKTQRVISGPACICGMASNYAANTDARVANGGRL
jgi:cyanophycinase-like exopeptidase